ncbi:acyl-CoA dehydrogenase family protein [Actinomadura fulvescens]|uniref:Acyl-CoA dehydrogenase family protein n=1 Tax=Actinomadura fulvescens TaxID=46160 RepID=A0ABN3QHL1_9ACTN
MSDGFLTDDHHRLRQRVRAFAETEVAPHVAAMESSGRVETALAQLIAAQGWIGVTIDPAYGGMGAGHLAKTLIIEELARISGAMGAMAQASQLGTATIINYGNDDQKQRWLPQIAAGTCLPTIAVTEPGSGSHVLGMRSTARRTGRGARTHYVLTGRKSWIGNSHIGHLHAVVVRTGRGSRGLSAFGVEHDRPGLTATPYRPAMGLRGFGFGELILDRCRVPAANLIGQIGDGLAIAYSSSILYGRPNLTAVALGLHQAIVDQTVSFAQHRRRYNAPLAQLPTIRDKIGLLQQRLMTARILAYHAVHQLDHGQPCDHDLINAKYLNVAASRDSARDAMDIHAAAALHTDLPLERFFRDVQHLFAPAGTGDIQLHRLAEAALGLGHRQWSQRLAHLTRHHPDATQTRTSAPAHPTAPA